MYLYCYISRKRITKAHLLFISGHYFPFSWIMKNIKKNTRYKGKSMEIEGRKFKIKPV